MEHFNPILGSEPNGQKFITCGENMLRLNPPNYEKIHPHDPDRAGRDPL